MPAHVKNKNSTSGIKWVQEEMDMELKKVWMSPETEKKSRYGYRAVGGFGRYFVSGGEDLGCY